MISRQSDADLNQDSAIRDTYQNSTTTFKVAVTDSSGNEDVSKIATSPMTLIETTPTSGVFVATFTVPDYNGNDLEVTYYESKDSGGNTIELYDTATVTSNSGSVSFDKSVYPVPFDAGDLHEGDDSTDLSSINGNVTITVVVEDADFTGDSLTTTSTNAAGTIKIMLVEGSTTSTCWSAGSTVATASVGDGAGTNTLTELGPLAAINFGTTSEYEIEFVTCTTRFRLGQRRLLDRAHRDLNGCEV